MLLVLRAEGPRRLGLLMLLLIPLSISCRESGVSGPEPAAMPSLSLPNSWRISPPILEPPVSQEFLSYSEPAPVHCGEHWHLLCSRTLPDGTRDLAHFRFENWSSPPEALSFPGLESFNGSPQVLYWDPLEVWLLLYATDPSGSSKSLEFVSLSSLDRPLSRVQERPIFSKPPLEGAQDFWMIADEERVHLFFTSTSRTDLVLRLESSIEEFPSGWSEPVPAIRGDVTGPARVYSTQGSYLAIVEAHFQWRRYYKAYRAQNLNGPWKPQAVTRTHPFLGLSNSDFEGDAWTDTFRHGQLLPASRGRYLSIDPTDLRFFFHGSSYASRDGRKPFQIPWKIGLAQAVRSTGE